MPNFGKWFGTGRILTKWRGDQFRSQTWGAVINDQVVNITIDRQDSETQTHSFLEPQPVRIDMAGTPNERELSGMGGAVARQKVLVVGYKNHKQIPNTDIQRGDRFFFNDRNYEVIAIEDHFDDRLLAIAETTQ